MPQKPKIFIGSSGENRSLADAIQANLADDALCTVWNQGIFALGDYSLDGLKRAVDNYPFAILVFSPDDQAAIRETEFRVARDNVVFELGMFLGRLSSEHVMFLCPSDVPEFHVPSDLKGIVHGTYDSASARENPRAAVGAFCLQVRERIAMWRKATRVIRGPLHVRNLHSIGGDWEPEPTGDIEYEFRNEEVRIKGDQVEFSADVKITGRIQADGRMVGKGEFFHGIAFIVYSTISDSPPFHFKGVCFLRISDTGACAGYWMADDGQRPDLPRLAVGDAWLSPFKRGVAGPVEGRPQFHGHLDRRPAIPGVWRGSVHYHQEPAGLQPQSLELTLSCIADRVIGSAKVNYADERKSLATFAAEGTVQVARFVYLKFKSNDPGAVHFGTLLAELNATGTRLTGALVAYGARADAVVTAKVELEKAPPA